MLLLLTYVVSEIVLYHLHNKSPAYPRTQRQLLYNTKEATQRLRINMAAEQNVLNCICHAEGLSF